MPVGVGRQGGGDVSIPGMQLNPTESSFLCTFHTEDFLEVTEDS